MTNDPLSFIDEAPATDAPKAPEPVTSEATPATGERPRDDQGRFAPKEPVAAAPKAPDPAPQPIAPAPATPAPVIQQEHSVPLAKYLDRDSEARELKRENQRLLQQLQAKNAPPPQQLPDPIQDPDGYRQAILAEAQKGWGNDVKGIRLEMSEQMARQVYGDEKVNAAFKALEDAQDVHAYNRVMNSPHPAAEIVKWHQQKQLLDQIGNDPDAYVRRRWAELNPADPANPAAPGGQPPPQQAAPVIPASSLSKAPAGMRASDVPVGPGNAFDATFAR